MRNLIGRHVVVWTMDGGSYGAKMIDYHDCHICLKTGDDWRWVNLATIRRIAPHDELKRTFNFRDFWARVWSR